MSDPIIGVGHQMTLTRTFDAPRQLVFDCFSKVEHMQRWWGPRMFTAPVCELDPRPGGAILIHMKGPAPYGINPMGGEYVEVSPPGRLTFVSRAFPGEDGEWGIENFNELTFEETADGKTLITVTVTVRKVNTEFMPALARMREGWSQSLDKLGELLAELQ
jgi:uncharacterized protein YndB with AHSA1/START domain